MCPRRRAIKSERVAHLLGDSPEWKVLAHSDIKSLKSALVVRSYIKGEFVFREGDSCSGVHVVIDGLVVLRKAGPHGEPTILRLAGPGNTLGYRPLLAGQNHRASAEALGDATTAFLARDKVISLITDNPSLGLAFLRKAARDLGDAEDRFHHAVSLTVRERVINLLHVLRDEYGRPTGENAWEVELPLIRKDLAAMLGVRRESVARILQDLRNEGCIRMRGRLIELLRLPEIDHLDVRH